MATPKVFVSYSHDSDAHKAWVLKLAEGLRGVGIDVTLDYWDLVPGQDISLFMQRGVAGADRVLLVCSDNYVIKSEIGAGGVGYERLIVTSEMIQAIDTIKFIPVIRNKTGTRLVPNFIGPRLYVDFRHDDAYESKLVELAREIHGAPAVSKPPLGPNPFSGTAIPAAPAKTFSHFGRASLNEGILDIDWFGVEQRKASSGLSKLQLEGSMELRVGLHFPLAKSQIELLNAVRSSEIRTFGWPIGITLENRDEYRPRPYGDGIKAEVSINDGPTAGRVTYDYWALRSSGDFYLLQSLFEDSRRPRQIFFDTRIVRVTECLMFAQNVYKSLGAPEDSNVSVRITHNGLTDRSLVAASQNRLLRPRSTKEAMCTSEVLTVLGKMGESRIGDVRKLLEPLFMLFDFQQFDPTIYEDLVRNFESGRII